MAKKINITAELNAATKEGKIADAAQIYDAQAGKFQGTINKELTEAVDDVERRLLVADGEDLVTDGNVLRLKDRPNTDGMGYVILRKDKTFQEQVTKPNTIYEIRYDFDLGRQEAVILENCVLKFDGGSINNGVIVGTNTKTINADFKCNLDGVFIEKNCIKIKYDSSIIDYTELINNIFSHFRFSNIVFDNAVYGINGSFIKERIGILINGNNNYHFNGCTFKQLNNNNIRSAIIFIENVSNISLGYFNIEGDARTHISTGSTDEWNAGIEIGSNVDNIRIHDVSVYDTTGDCIEIALYGSKKNIQVSRCRLNNGRRNYISIEAGDNIIIENCIFTKDADFSVAPNCFIDIEPMKSEGGVPVRNVIIRNNYFNNIKQTSQGISIIAGFEDSVSNVNIYNNLIVGNISLVGNINILGKYGSNIVIFNNTIKVTSLEYPYFDSLRHIIGVNGASAEFYNNRIEGLQAGTVAFRVWNGGNAYIEGCTIKNARMLVGRGNTDEGISNMSLNNCIIENNNSESIFYSTYTHNVKIDKCNIKAKDTVILALATYYDISNSTLLSETGSVIDDTTYVDNVPMNDVKIKIRSSRLENQDYTKYVIIERLASIIIQNSTIYGGDIAIFLHTRGNEYTATALIDNCIIKHLNSEGRPLLFDGLLSCNINNTNIDTTGRSYLYAKSHSVIFRNSHFTGLNSKNGILYSEIFSAVDLINCTLNGIPINGRSEQEEAEEEDYSDLTLLKSVKIYGGYRWNRDKKMPMWWNGKAWVDSKNVDINQITCGTTEERPYSVDVSLGTFYFDTTLNKLIWWNGTEWVEGDNQEAGIQRAGTWPQRPNADGRFLDNGFQYFLLESEPDEDPDGNPMESITGNGKPIWWIQDSGKWVDSTGATVTG